MIKLGSHATETGTVATTCYSSVLTEPSRSFATVEFAAARTTFATATEATTIARDSSKEIDVGSQLDKRSRFGCWARRLASSVASSVSAPASEPGRSKLLAAIVVAVAEFEPGAY